MNEKLEQLSQEIEKTEKKLRWAEQEEKRLIHQAKTLTRKERTHRLCTRGAILESCLLDLCQYFGQKKSKDYAVFLSSSSSFCCGVK